MTDGSSGGATHALGFDPYRDRATWALLLSAFALYLAHLLRNSFLNFGHDVPDHLFYIYYIYKNHRLPLPYEGRECYHMPLYYLLSAIVCWVGAKAGMSQPFTLVRFVSMFFWFGYIHFAICLLRDHCRSRLGYYLALSMLLFTPMSVVCATQILNETPLTMTQFAGFYHLTRWWKTLEAADLRRALTWNAFAIAFKTSGLVLTGVIVVVVLARWWSRRFAMSALLNRSVAIGTAAMVLVGGSALFRNLYYYRLADQRSESLMVSNAPNRFQADLPPHPAYYFFGLDIDTFVRHPFLEGSKWATPFIWNMTLKTALLTKRAWHSPFLGTVLSVLLLLLLAYGLWASGSMFRHSAVTFEAFPMAFFVGVQLLLLMGFRALYWLPATSDYRYIYAITPILALVFARSIEWYQSRGPKGVVTAATALSALFSIAGMALVIDQAIAGS